MKKRLLLAILLGLIPTTAFCDDEVECNSNCGEGEKIVSYSDGNTVTCQCVQEAAMEPTVPDPQYNGDLGEQVS